jgi:hypothetical protein
MREHPSPRIIHQGQAPGGRCCALGAPLGILLIAFAFYLLGLPASFVHNDEAHGAVVWIYDLPGTLAAVARDSHPPLYYLVLWGWLRLVPHPFALKFVSPFFALLALALTYRLVAEAAGRRAAAGAMLLMAFNPLFFALATLGRMYPMAIAAAALGFRQALRRRDGSWLLSAWALTLTHFYGLLFLPAQRLLIPGWRPRLRELGRMALALLPIAGWSLWALGPSMAHTVRTLSRIPVRPTPPEVLANLMGALGIGIGADGQLGMLGALAVALGILASWRARRLWGAMALPVGLGLLLTLRFPFYAARYFAPLLPLYAWALAAGGSARRRALWPLLLSLGLYGIGRTWAVYANAPIYAEAQRELYATLFETAHPTDRIAFHGYWNQAEMALFYPETRPRLLPLEAIRPADSSLPTRTWVVGVTFFQDLYRPVVEALAREGPFDVHAWYPMAEVFRFVPWEEPAPWRPTGVRFEQGIVLEAVAWLDPVTDPGGSIRVGLRWRAEGIPEGRYVVFLHLWDEQGRYRAGVDREPDPPTSEWQPGQLVTQTLALAAPPFLPAGRYRLMVGLYERLGSGWRRLRTAEGAEAWQIGEAEIRPRLASASASGIPLPGGITVRPQGAWRTTLDGTPRLRVHLLWQTDRPLPDDTHRLWIRGPDGTMRPLDPPEGWFPGSRIAGEEAAEIWEWREPLPPGRYQVFWEGGGLFPLFAFRIPPEGYRWDYDWIFRNRLPW